MIVYRPSLIDHNVMNFRNVFSEIRHIVQFIFAVLESAERKINRSLKILRNPVGPLFQIGNFQHRSVFAYVNRAYLIAEALEETFPTVDDKFKREINLHVIRSDIRRIKFEFNTLIRGNIRIFCGRTVVLLVPFHCLRPGIVCIFCLI